ncbi:MAG: zinc-binding alcohol dehydrogenase family protein [Myxococcota bacterium]|nr:zinc-binding alcohol dehydrogenase family protein [Myxococcota bacterium]
MKAVFLERPGAVLQLVDVPEPALRAGAVRVRVTRAPVLSFMRAVVAGELGYTLPTPSVPGPNAIGVVDAVADDVFGIAVGQHVFLDPGLASGGERALLGLTGISPGAARLQALYRNGTFAEKVLVPAENLTPLPTGTTSDDALACLSYLVIPFGGLRRGELRPGQTVIVSGATGNLGAGGVLVALSMGASKVVAVGRERAVLTELERLGRRVVSVALSGQRERDAEAVREAAGGSGADLVLDLLGSATTPDPTMACIAALRLRGTAVLMGSVRADLCFPYLDLMLREIAVRGCFMYGREAPAELAAMVAAGTLDLSPIRARTFPLSECDLALEEASRSKGLHYCMLAP